MKWTFFIAGKDGKSYFPKRTGSGQIELVDAWTLDIQEAVLWDKPEDLEPLANEFCNVCIVSITPLEQFAHNKIEFPEFNDNLLEEFDKQFFENGQDDDLTEVALEQKE